MSAYTVIPMLKLYNPYRYIASETLEKCFTKGVHNKVDKVVTGNGFSTAFLMAIPKPGMVNIMIAPNKAVVIDKQSAVRYYKIETDNRIGFFYKEGLDQITGEYDVLVFVTDSFRLYASYLSKIQDRINWILIDEQHSVEIQSVRRSLLRDFETYVERYLTKSSSIVSVTASPNYFSKPDIQIINAIIPPQTIHVTPNRNKSIERAISDINSGKRVVIATNDVYVLYRLKNRKRELRANFIVGESFLRSAVAAFTVIHDPDSDLVILSSRGFEGFDIPGEGWKVYFFEDRGRPHETFYISNLYQAINRTRAGAIYIEYSIRRPSEVRPRKVTESEIDTFINDQSISIETKQTKRFAKYHPYVIFNEDVFGQFTIKKDVIGIQLMEECLLYDNGFDDFEEFLSKRNITLVQIKEKKEPVKQSKIRMKIKKKNLAFNIKFIEQHNLFGDDFKLIVQPLEDLDAYRKNLIQFLIRKRYDTPELGHARELTKREAIALRLFSYPKEFDALLMKVTKAYNKRSINKYGKTASKKFRDDFKKSGARKVAQFIQAFTNHRVSFPPHWSAHRNYTLLTQIGVGEIEIIADAFGLTIQEIDLKSAFPRILYALVNETLPADFYGSNKENKIAINKALNSFYYNKNKPSDLWQQQSNAKRMLTKLGLNPKVIDYLMDRFFEVDHKGKLFHFLSFHEKKAIKELRERIEGFSHIGAHRRHDSLILIIDDEVNDLTELNDFRYLGVDGWFDFEEISSEPDFPF